MTALTATEAAILALWDAGLDKRRIASRMGLPLDRVRKIVDRLHGDNEARDHRRAMIAGSTRLLAALQAAA